MRGTKGVEAATVAAAGATRRAAAVLAAVAGLLAAVPASAAEAPAAGGAPVRWTIGDVVSIALANNPAVGGADAAVRAAVARSGQAAAAKLPQLDAAAGWTHAEAHSSSGAGQDGVSTTSAKASATQLITDFGRTGAVVAKAEDLAAASAESARSSRVEVAYAAEIAYFNVLRAASLQEVRQQTIRQRETLLRQAQAFYDAGLRARIDVVRAEASLYQARADAASVLNDLRTSRMTLLNRMGIDGPADFVLAGVPDVIEVAGTLDDWMLEADQRHPDLNALRLQVAAAGSNRLAAARAARPTVAAVGNLGWTGTDELPADNAWSVGATLSLPLLDGGMIRQQTAEAEAQLAVAEFALADRRRQILLLVQQADQALKDVAEVLVAREKQREASAENLRLATGRYEAGAADIIEMIDAQVQMTESDANIVQARFTQGVALAALYRALGRFPKAGP